MNGAITVEKIEQGPSKHKMLNSLLSYQVMVAFYGVYLFLYELRLVRSVIAPIHPAFILWAVIVIGYHMVFRKEIKKLYGYLPLLLFSVVAVLASLTNYEAGLIGNMKACFLALLPIFAFYPLCFTKDTSKRTSLIIKTLLGASVVVCAASAIALVMYLIRFYCVVDFMGTTQKIGMGLYNPSDAASGLLVWGLYFDTNHAAVYAMIFAVYSVLLYYECTNGLFSSNKKNKIGKSYALINLIIQVCYFPLANSRGGWVSFVVSGMVVFGTWWYSKFLKEGVNLNMVVKSVLATVVCVGLLAGGILIIRTAESGVSNILEDIFHMDAVEEIQPTEEETTEQTSEIEQREDIPIVNGYLREKDGKPRMMWEEVKGATEYHVYRSEDGTTFKKMYTTTGLSYTNTSAVYGKTYYYKVRAIFGKKEGDDSSVITLTALQPGQTGKTDNFKKKNTTIGSGRLLIWSEVPELLKAKPLFGTGIGNNAYYAQKYQIAQKKIAKGVALHNSYLDVVACYGIIGASVFADILAFGVWNMLKGNRKKLKECSVSHYVGLFIMLFVSIQAVFLSNLFINTTAAYYIWLIIVGYLLSESNVRCESK